jgi:hypothetical protein
LSKLTN